MFSMFRAMASYIYVISIVVMFHYYWCTMNPWSPFTIFHKNNNIA